MGQLGRVPARSFQDLLVWQQAHDLVLETYLVTRAFPRDETYGLSSQMRRAATSVPANIAEGFRKRGRADKARFYNIAEASLDEVHYYFILAGDLGYADCTKQIIKLGQVSRLLKAYTRKLLAPNV